MNVTAAQRYATDGTTGLFEGTTPRADSMEAAPGVQALAAHEEATMTRMRRRRDMLKYRLFNLYARGLTTRLPSERHSGAG